MNSSRIILERLYFVDVEGEYQHALAAAEVGKGIPRGCVPELLYALIDVVPRDGLGYLGLCRASRFDAGKDFPAALAGDHFCVGGEMFGPELSLGGAEGAIRIIDVWVVVNSSRRHVVAPGCRPLA